MPITKRRVVKKPKLSPEQIEANRLERIRQNAADARRWNEQEAARQLEAAQNKARHEAELAADTRPRWMRESVVDPDWLEAYNKAHRYDTPSRPFQLGSDMLDCVYHAGGRASCDVFGNQDLAKLGHLARASTDEDCRANLSEDADASHEFATAIAAIIAATFDAADDTIPEDGKPGQLPDRTKAEKSLASTLTPALRRLKDAVDALLGRVVTEDDIIRDQLQEDLCEVGKDEVTILAENVDVAQIIRDMGDLDRMLLCRELGIPVANLGHLA